MTINRRACILLFVAAGAVFCSLEALADWDSASTKATTADGEVSIRGVDSTAIHEHGGAAAKLGECRFEVTNSGKRPRTLTAGKIEFLTGHNCKQPPSTVGNPIHAAGLMVEETDQKESQTTVTIPAGVTRTVSLGFAPAVDAYYVFCDRFAFRAAFQVDGAKPVLVTAETNVTRVEPLRPREPD